MKSNQFICMYCYSITGMRSQQLFLYFHPQFAIGSLMDHFLGEYPAFDYFVLSCKLCVFVHHNVSSLLWKWILESALIPDCSFSYIITWECTFRIILHKNAPSGKLAKIVSVFKKGNREYVMWTTTHSSLYSRLSPKCVNALILLDSGIILFAYYM